MNLNQNQSMKFQSFLDRAEGVVQMFNLRYPMRGSRFIALLALLTGLGFSAIAAETPDAVKAKEHELLQVLRSDAPPAEKAITCKKLAIYGSEEAVPLLA